MKTIRTAILIVGVGVLLAATWSHGATAARKKVARQGSQASVEDELVKMEKDSWEAWKGRDSKFFERFLSDDHVEMGFTGPAGKALVVATVASPNCVVKSYTVDNFKVVVFAADAAVVTYHAAQDTVCSGTAVPSPVWVSSTFIKRDGRWLNAVYQQSQDTRKK